MRDGAAHVLRCLKVWFDLPSCVLLSALNLMDRFMSRMKARPKHLSCIAISAFHLAACQWAQKQPTTDAAATTAAATATTKPRVNTNRCINSLMRQPITCHGTVFDVEH